MSFKAFALILALCLVPSAFAKPVDQWNNTPLITAIMKGQTEVAKNLLLKGADFDNQNILGSTALMEAVKRHNTYLVKLLLKIKARHDLRDIEGNTALIHAAKEKKTALVKLLVDAGADPNVINKHENDAMNIAVKNSDASTVSFLLSLSSLKPVTLALLNEAAGQDQKDAVVFSILLASSKQALSADELGEALVSAANNRCLAAIKVILKAYPQLLNYQTKEDHETALFQSVFQGSFEAVRWLLSLGADPNLMSITKERALDRADADNVKIISILKKHGAIKGENPDA